MSRMSELAVDFEFAKQLAGAKEDEVGRDVTKLMSVTSDLVLASRHVPELLARDYELISSAHEQLGRMLSRIVHREAAE